MKILLRADAGVARGTGHVMRCLTLAESLRAAGHSVELVGSVSGVTWLQQLLESSGIRVSECNPDALDIDGIMATGPDWVVVDSYTIDSGLISELNSRVPVLAIVDGDVREINATLYLDQNLGADQVAWTGDTSRYLLGISYALVREAFTARRRDEPWRSRTPPRVLAMMGGTDPTGAILRVVAAILESPVQLQLTAVAAPEFHADLLALAVARPEDLRAIAPTSALPELLASSDIVVSAAGTSAWDVCSLGIPAVFIAIVENQRESLARLVADDVAFGVDVVELGPTGFREVTSLIELIVNDPDRREAMSRRALAMFDGGGASRVVDRMVAATWTPN